MNISKRLICIISFSFVNNDIRDIFRSQFPFAEWILIDTSEDEATKRIKEREGHFYKGQTVAKSKINDIGIVAEPTANAKDDLLAQNDDKDNSDWKFDTPNFSHAVFDGYDSIQVNAEKIVERIMSRLGD